MLQLAVSSCKHVPTLPVVEYNNNKSEIQIVQTDTAAHDSAYIAIGDIYSSVIPIKDTVTVSVIETIKKQNQLEVAYKLATHNNMLDVSIRTSRTNDTVFQYRYSSFDIKPINVAEVVSGQCCGFYDVNDGRDYHGKIRQWIFKNDLTPDSSIIEKTNSILRQFNYSGKKEYSVLINRSTPIVKSLSGLKYRFKAQLKGDYFYLYAYSCSSGMPIKSFVEQKITKGLDDAHHHTNEEFTCSNRGGSGPNILFLVGIDKNWNYAVLPIGIVVVDDLAPKITAGRVLKGGPLINNNVYENSPSLTWPKTIALSEQNMVINIPDIYSITASVYISYGSFEGNSYYGYNIPFYIISEGDVQSLTIGAHKLNVNSIRNGECIRLNIKGLHIGDNSIPLTAVDSRGNKSTRSLSIPLYAIRNERSNRYEDDYDELEDRINDLENRIDDLE